MLYVQYYAKVMQTIIAEYRDISVIFERTFSWNDISAICHKAMVLTAARYRRYIVDLLANCRSGKSVFFSVSQARGKTLHVTEFVKKNYHRYFLISTNVPVRVLCVMGYNHWSFTCRSQWVRWWAQLRPDLWEHTRKLLLYLQARVLSKWRFENMQR